MVAAALAIVAAYVAFVLLRLGVHQRLPLALRPISLERIPDRAARRHGDRPLFSCDVAPAWHVPALRGRYASETQWTALRIESTAGFVAALMRGLGVTRGDRVAILKANHFDIHVLVAGIVRAGAIACPMNGRFPASKVAPYIENIGASTLITDVPTLSRVLCENGALGGVTTVVIAAKRSESDQAQRALLGTLDSREGQCRVIPHGARAGVLAACRGAAACPPIRLRRVCVRRAAARRNPGACGGRRGSCRRSRRRRPADTRTERTAPRG